MSGAGRGVRGYGIGRGAVGASASESPRLREDERSPRGEWAGLRGALPRGNRRTLRSRSALGVAAREVDDGRAYSV